MKQLYYLILAGLISLTACKDDGEFLYQGDTVVRFVSSTTTLGENDVSVKAIVVVITGPQGITPGISASFTAEPVNDAAASGTTFIIENETDVLSFRNGISDTIYIRAVDNSDADGAKEIKISLASEGTAGVGLPGEAANLSTHTVIINDDDCALDITAFAQDFNTCEIGYGSFDAPVSLHPSQDNTLVIENLGDWGIADAILVFDPDVSTSTITVQMTQAGILGGTTPVFWSGTGKYIACTGEFQVSYQIVFADGSPWGPGGGTDIWTAGANPGCSPLF